MIAFEVVRSNAGRCSLVGPAALGTLALVALVALLCASIKVSRREAREELVERVVKLRQRFSTTHRELRQSATPPSDDIDGRQVTEGVVSRFLPYVQEDLDHEEYGRAASELSSLEAMMDRLAHPKNLLPGATITHAHNGSSLQGRRLKVEGGAIVVASRAPDEERGINDRPVFLTGYGVFQRVRDDVEQLPTVGANLVQVEIGPSEIFPKPGIVDRKPLDALVNVLDRAARTGVAVDVLLSPHYFPTWMLEQVPALRRRREGFVQFCTHHSAARDFLRRYIHTVIDVIKDHPALLSVCLANEPQNVEEPCEPARQNWRLWLRKHHGGVEGFNIAHGAKLRDLEGVPLPNPYDPPRDRALWADFVRFNQEQHADWIGMLAAAVHEVAPDLPVHVKALTPLLLGRMSQPAVGIDPTLLTRYSGLNGNDAYNLFQFGRSDFAESWQENAMGHDLQKSLNPTPIFNSENHIILDRESRAVPPGHIRAALWQAAVRGQAASTIWVWERSFDRKSDFWGSILERPDAVEAVGLTNIDLNRAAPELRALQDAPIDLTILSSTSALTWDHQVPAVTEALYTALSFTGLKIGFITERQLEDGIGPATSILFVPGNVHISQRALGVLATYRGRIVFVGSDQLLSRDDHDHPTAIKIPAEVLGAARADSWRVLWPELNTALTRWKVVSPVQISDTQGKAVWGVEWRSTLGPSGSWIVNMCNFRHDSIKVQLARDGRSASGQDVLTGLSLPRIITLGSLDTRLLRLN